jgi:hypothetical protein
MDFKLSICRTGLMLVAILGVAHTGISQASLPQSRGAAGFGTAVRADSDFARIFPASPRARAAGSVSSKPASARQRAPGANTVSRTENPVLTATATGTGQAGYVHYFLLRMPDDSLEMQVGVEMHDQQIAWSFPDIGVVISPFLDSGILTAGGKEYEVWHLYGIRPFPDDAAMDLLRRELANRVQPWIHSAIPYCENDGPHSGCMSCLGFVLRVLFPGKHGAYPDLPRDFWRAGMAAKYTTKDLLLYLTGMLDIQTREARLRRIAQLKLPHNLRDDVEELVYSMGSHESAAANGSNAAKNSSLKSPTVPASKFGARPARGRKL